MKDNLRTLPCSPTVHFKLEQLLDSLAFNEKQVVKTAQRDPAVLSARA